MKIKKQNIQEKCKIKKMWLKNRIKKCKIKKKVK